jgi:MFS family permease
MQFVAARIIQGAASGPLAPLSIAILLDILLNSMAGSTWWWP